MTLVSLTRIFSESAVVGNISYTAPQNIKLSTACKYEFIKKKTKN